MQASTYSSCVAPQEVTRTASTALSAISSSPVAKISAPGSAVGHGLGPGGVDVGHRDHGLPASTWFIRRM